MQRREQQRRTASTGGGGGGGASGYLGGGITGYSPVPRFDTPDPVPSRITTSSPAPLSSTRAPVFKGTGMKLGSKKTKQAELIDAMGGDALETTSLSMDISAPATPSVTASPPPPVSGERGSVPEVVAERLAQANIISCVHSNISPAFMSSLKSRSPSHFSETVACNQWNSKAT